MLVVDKPCGLLSVPGRHDLQRDSALVRLRRRYPEASGPLVVHPLDLEASGLLLAAKEPETHGRSSASSRLREASKRYVAWLEGSVSGEEGTVELPLRSDSENRSRHIVDPVHGKHAVTEWRVTQRTGTRTRVALLPRTGRTHQLRVHAAHPLGLGAPISGDRLYGQDALACCCTPRR